MPNSSPAPSEPDAAQAVQPDTLERLVAESPSIEVISSAWMLLMSAAAEKLGLTGGDEVAEDTASGDAGAFDPRRSPHFDLDEARRLITALAGLTTASVEYLGPHAGPYRDGLKSLQLAFREYSSYPDEPGRGPGEKYTGPVYS
ncbi:recombinase RecA [Tsukamurella pseudospumae]|uniref:Recombinase RecA n=1 Tax=Tsukamurella pseudospumae TaxID=239498 RepID=A0A137ZR96_9ACTN|nr:recombinase RecA [Tsukamurella pseudospumae]